MVSSLTSASCSQGRCEWWPQKRKTRTPDLQTINEHAQQRKQQQRANSSNRKKKIRWHQQCSMYKNAKIRISCCLASLAFHPSFAMLRYCHASVESNQSPPPDRRNALGARRIYKTTKKPAHGYGGEEREKREKKRKSIYV